MGRIKYMDTFLNVLAYYVYDNDYCIIMKYIIKYTYDYTRFVRK